MSDDGMVQGVEFVASVDTPYTRIDFGIRLLYDMCCNLIAWLIHRLREYTMYSYVLEN
jgi:hypothetical protein